MDKKTAIAKYNNANYLIYPEFDSTLISNDKTPKYKNNCNFISYLDGTSDTIDFRFAQPEDHINLDLNQKFDFPIKHVYINSMNMVNTFIFANKPMKDTVLHINMNHYNVNMDELKITPRNARFINDLQMFLPSLNIGDNQPIFGVVSFENMSFALASEIREICESANITRYGMKADEKSHSGYFVAANAQKTVKIIKNKPLTKLNINTTKYNLSVDKEQ